MTLALWNSIKVSGSVTLVCISMGSLTAYAFSRLKFKGSGAAFVGVIVTQMLPPITLLIPIYLLFKTLHLINSLAGLAILIISFNLPVATALLYTYFKSIPGDLEDSARVDGSTRVGAIYRIFIPISWPGIVSTGIIIFIFSMGSFMPALTILTNQELHTLPLALAKFISRSSIGWGPMTASAVIAIIIPIAIVFIFQRYIIKGLTAGAIKE